MRRGLTPRMVVASGLLVLVIGTAFVVVLLAVDDLRDTTRLSRQSQEVLSTANRLERLVIDLETGERGFLLSGEERFLQPWEAARLAIPSVSEELMRAGVPAQDRRARQIAQAVRSYVRDYSVPLVDAARRNEVSARGTARIDEGKRRVDALRARFNRFTAAEDRLGVTRQEHSESAARQAVVAVTAGLAGSIVLIIFFAGYLTWAIVQPVRRAATMAGRLAAGDLTVRMPETGAGEIGELEHAFNTMGSSLEASREELRLLVEEQAALRRVATLVARAVSPTEVFDAVTTEVARLLDADFTALLRYGPDGTATMLGVRSEAPVAVPVGKPFELAGGGPAEAVLRTGRATRMDETDALPSVVAQVARELGLRSSVATPIVVEGRLWGAIVAAWTPEAPQSADTEGRMAEFTELVGTAVANAESRAELAASRARVVAASDETRRRIERDLHDGTQQRLVSLGLELRAAQATAPPGDDELEGQLSAVVSGLADAVENLQEITRGIHPAVLSEGGLGPALKTLARRSAVPVELDLRTERRLPQQIERAAYYVVSEALTNAAKHARASVVDVRLEIEDATLALSIRDDGVGGASPGQGSGLIGLTDRVEALGGKIEITSRPGTGTSLRVTIPIDGSQS